MFNIVLVSPEIPQNTGNIARLCAAAGSRLHLVRPLGFEITDKHLKRAGLDYWNLVEIIYYENTSDFFEKNRGKEMYFSTTKAKKSYTEFNFMRESYLIFGRETKGLDEELLKANAGRCMRIPMISEARSLNLSNSVAIVLYEAIRQNNLSGQSIL